MASMDHTAPTCFSVRNEPKSKHIPYAGYQLYPLSPAQESRLTDTSRIAGTLLATIVIDDLLAYSDACKQARFHRKRDVIDPWPLTPAQASGLCAALYYLHQYVGTLQSERGG